MTLETLQSEMIKAMKEHNKPRKDAISSLISAVKKAAIDKMCKGNITESLVNEVILKEKKTVQEMIDTCPDTRDDLLNEYEYRLSVISEFAPKLVTDINEIRNMIFDILSDADIEIRKENKGLIMKTVMPVLKGKADTKLANEVLTKLIH